MFVSQLNVSLKNTGPTILLALIALSLVGAGLLGTYMDSVNSSNDYFAYLCILASGTTPRQKVKSTANRSHLRQKTVETSSKN
jgi:hypothetical protein